MSTKNLICTTFLFLNFIFCSKTLFAQTIHYQDFEGGIGNWWVDNGLWEVGIPIVGPNSAHSGQNCAGTDLDANYPPNANTRLASPYIILPTISPGEQIKLKFWYWFRMDENYSIYGIDWGYIQISVNNGPWQTIADPISGWSTTWTQGFVDLSTYADSTVRIAFYMTSSGAHEDNGWYIDDISISVGTPIFNNPEDFEQGTGDWSADNGLWELGIPTVGPATAHSGQNCIGTILGGNYPPFANTRLVSPKITLDSIPGSFVGLYFWHWFRLDEDNFYGYDQGWVQISVNMGPWQIIAGPFSGISTVWSQCYVDLSTYVDSTVRIAFYMTSSGAHEDNGWYIDDVRIEGITTVEENIILPNVYLLCQNYPNPFNPTTKIKYQIPEISFVTLKVFDVLGNELATVVNEEKAFGSYEVEFEGTDLPSGVYFYRLQAGAFAETKKMIILK